MHLFGSPFFSKCSIFVEVQFSQHLFLQICSMLKDVLNSGPLNSNEKKARMLVFIYKKNLNPSGFNLAEYFSFFVINLDLSTLGKKVYCCNFFLFAKFKPLFHFSLVYSFLQEFLFIYSSFFEYSRQNQLSQNGADSQPPGFQIRTRPGVTQPCQDHFGVGRQDSRSVMNCQFQYFSIISIFFPNRQKY